MEFFFFLAAIIFLLLALITLIIPDILLNLDRMMSTPIWTQKQAIKNHKGVRLMITFLFLFASFWMWFILFTKSYKAVEKPKVTIDYRVD